MPHMRKRMHTVLAVTQNQPLPGTIDPDDSQLKMKYSQPKTGILQPFAETSVLVLKARYRIVWRKVRVGVEDYNGYN
jgi:hypothetical protein